MRRVGVPVDAHDTILHALRFAVYDEVFAVHSLTYGALGFGGRTDPKVCGDSCPVHHLAANLNGVCDYC